jgi:hypothetical protein
MSSQLVSIVPAAPLTDDVFPFNRDAFIQIQNYQKKDLAFLSSPAIAPLVGVGDIVGGTSTAVVGGVGAAASGVASSLFGGLGTITSGLGLPVGGLLQPTGQTIVGGINTADSAAQQLVDPTQVARQHYHYSAEVQKALPPAIAAVDKLIHDFSIGTGQIVQQLSDNLATQGPQIINGLSQQLALVDAALAALYSALTADNIQENLVVGQDKYKASSLSNQTNYLSELSQYLPPVLQTIKDVQAAFATIASNFKTALAKINSGVTNYSQIFAESPDTVVDAWKAFEVKRKTLTYLPYQY